MRQRGFFVVLALTAALTTGCAQFEQVMSTVGPSGAPSVASLLGNWTSSSSVGAGINSCTNFQWALTGQQGSAVTGQFSAICGSINVQGTVSGEVNGKEVPFTIAGSAAVAGAGTCSVSVSGTARIEGDAIRVPYSGNTCFGPASGEEVLRRAQPTAAPPSASAPPPAPSPIPAPAPQPMPASVFHVGPGGLTFQRAENVVNATADEFQHLLSPRQTEADGVAAAHDLLRRMIWHLQLAGYQAGRQRNPSGALSNDKLTIHINGSWHAFDVFRSVGTPGEWTDVIFLEVFPAGHLADGGIADN